MQPVACGTCGARVTARKASWDQTTVQWTAEAYAACAERAEARPRDDRPNRNAFAGCGALTAAIREAAVRGELDVHSDEPLKSNPEGRHL
jgi:hypothetical protein